MIGGKDSYKVPKRLVQLCHLPLAADSVCTEDSGTGTATAKSTVLTELMRTMAVILK